MNEHTVLVGKEEGSSKHNRNRAIATGVALLVIVAAALVVGLSVGLRKNGNGGLPSFGEEMRRTMFTINSSIAFLNHGSFGAVPVNVLSAEQQYQRDMEFEPVQWIRAIAPPIMNSIMKDKMGPFLGVNGSDLVWVENASNGINAIIRSLPFKQGDKLVYTNLIYGMVLKTMEYIRDTIGVELIQINITFPTSHAKIIELVNNTLNITPGVRFAVFDHISSTPAIIFPVKELSAMCRQRDIWVMFDGAHAFGQIPVNLTDFDPDFWTGNCHKWLYSPKGSAVLYVRNNMQALIHPTVISFGYGQDYQQQFGWVGTMDFTPYLAAGVAFDWMDSMGFEKIWSYQKNLCDFAGKLMMEKWNTTLYFVDPTDTAITSGMVNAKLPYIINETGVQNYWYLLDHYGIEVVFFTWENYLYTRVSCTVYTSQQDMIKYVNAVLDLINKYEQHQQHHNRQQQQQQPNTADTFEKRGRLSFLTEEMSVFAV